MSDLSILCPTCQLPLRAGDAPGFCAACLWRGLSDDGAEGNPVSTTPEGAAPGLFAVPGHSVIAELARGGMGIVYRARQHAPARDVALKMLLPHQLGSWDMRARFQVEVRACALLDHPAILPVYEVGEVDGQPFFTMKLATGGTLAERQRGLRGCWREIAELCATLADAVQFAHAHGVLHRDLKPGNVLFDEAGRPYLSDFGLAKFTAESDAAAFTRSLATLGTPNYLAPEVAAGGAGRATTASDTYGLGAVLYELLAGRPPFVADSVPALLRKIADEEPAPLRTPKSKARSPRSEVRSPKPEGQSSEPEPPRSATTLDSGLRTLDFSCPPRDLERIVRKCLRKDPAGRYPAVGALGDDLRRWLRGEPVQAKPVTPLEIAGAWVRRNPALAVVSGLLLLALLTGVVFQVGANFRLRAALGQALLSEARLTRSTGRAGQRFDTLTLLRRAQQAVPGGGSSPRDWRTEVAAALAQPDVRLLARWPVPAGNYEGGEEFSPGLERYAADSAGGGCTIFDTITRRAVHVFPGRSNNPAYGFRFSRDGRWFAVGYGDGTAEVWSLESYQLSARLAGLTNLPVVPEFLHDGSGFLATHPEGGIFRHPFDAQKPAALVTRTAQPRPVLPSPDGTRLLGSLLATNVPAIWSLAGGLLVATGPALSPGAEAAAWSPDGASYALGSSAAPYAVAIIGARDNRSQAQFSDHELAVRLLAFHPDGQSLASAGYDGRLSWRSREPRGWRVQIDASHRVLRFSEDGRRLAFSPSTGELGLLELAPPEILHLWPAPGFDCDCAGTFELSRKGDLAVITSRAELRLLATGSGAVLDRFALPARLSWVNAFVAPDGGSVVASSLGWGVWRIALTGAGGTGARRFGAATRLAEGTGYAVQEFALDGRSLVIGEPWMDGGNGGPGVRIWLWPDGDSTLARQLAGGFPMAGFRLLHDGRTGFSSHWSHPDLSLWDTTTTNRLRGLGLDRPVHSQLSPDGRWLITATTAETVLWNTVDWSRATAWGPDARILVPEFSGDGRLVATGDARGAVTLRTVPAGEELLTLTPSAPLRVVQLHFSADASRLWLFHTDGRISEWNLAQLRRELATFGLDWQ